VNRVLIGGLKQATRSLPKLLYFGQLLLCVYGCASKPDEEAVSAKNVLAASAILSQQNSGLEDCDIPFDQLRTRATSCTRDQPAAGRRCEAYSPSQFTEVVLITKPDPGGSGKTEICSGTLIAADWALSAAHCFLGDTPATARVAVAGQDYVYAPGGPTTDIVTAINAVGLSSADRRRSLVRAIVHRAYSGSTSSPPYQNDLALIQFAPPYPLEYVQPAILARPLTFSSATTLAGYGYSNADGGTLGLFNVTWPVPMTPSASALGFRPADGSAFCQGDSGGPVFAGRYRGCRTTDPAGEPRPRLIQGVISYNAFPAVAMADATLARQWAQACKAGTTSDVMQSIVDQDRHNWICSTSGERAGGCP
jgi:hypothetical protein